MTARRLTCLCLPIAMLLLALGPAVSSAEKPLPQGKELTALIEKAEANFKKNLVLRQQFTSEELYRNRNWDKNGKQIVDETARYDNLFVGNLPYRCLIDRNGKPLPEKDAQKEQERYDKAVRERKEMSNDAKRAVLHRTFHSGLPFGHLNQLFENHVIRIETINGRKAYLIESTPRSDVHPSSETERTAMHWKQSSWIDCEDLIPVRMVSVKLSDDNHTHTGLTFTNDFIRREDTLSNGSTQSVWLQSSSRGEGEIQFLLIRRKTLTEHTYSNFKKFQVDVRLLEESAEEVEGK